MRWKYTIIMALGCLTLLISPLGAMQPLAAANAGKANWKAISLKGKTCRVSFPATPSHSTKVHSWADTKMQLSYDAYYAKGSKDFETMVFVIGYPQVITNNEKETVFRGVLQGFINHNSKNRLVHFKPIQSQNNQGIEFIVQNDKQFYLGRAFIKGNQLFFLIFQCRSLQTNQQSYQNFVESIHWK